MPPKNGSNNGIDDYGNVSVTAKEMADILGLSEQNVYNLRRRGVFQSIKAKRSEFQLGPSVRAYLQFKCGQESESEADFHKERALKEKANRELREILVKQTQEQLHSAHDVQAIVADSNADIRRRLSKFAHLLFLQVAGQTDPAQVKDVIDSQVRRVLNELRDYKPRDYYRRSKTREPEAEQFPDEPPQSTGRGWKKGRPLPEASESNRARWVRDPEALARTVRAMNDAKLAAPDKVRAKLSRAAKKRWQRMPREQKSAHMAKMRAARPADFAKRAVATRRHNMARASGAGGN
jgi:hypothetical protein